MISRTKKELDDILKLEEEIWEQKRRQKTMSFSIKKRLSIGVQQTR